MVSNAMLVNALQGKDSFGLEKILTGINEKGCITGVTNGINISDWKPEEVVVGNQKIDLAADPKAAKSQLKTFLQDKELVHDVSKPLYYSA